MKNPFAYLKHIVKDPINTIDEAKKRTKEIMPMLYVFAGILVVGIVLQLAAKLDFMAIFSFIGLAGVAFSLFLLGVAKNIKKKFEALTCDKCQTLIEIKTPEDFAKYVSFTVLKDEAVFAGYDGNKAPVNGVYSVVKFVGSSSAIVSVDITCPHCGEVKHLEFRATPFKCHAEAKNVGVLEYNAIFTSLEQSVRSAINDYNNPDKKHLVPYTLHSSKNPNFENRHTFKGANASDARPNYMGAKIDYRKDIEEMLEHYFVIPELNGTLVDPNKKKSK